MIASVAITGAVGAATAAIGLPTASVTAAPGDTVQILSFNDFHGHVEADTAGSIDGSFGGPAAGGGEFLSAKLAELRTAFTGDASFTVAAGDNIGATPFFAGLTRDEPTVETLNELGLDISGVGNHEFDDGIPELLRMQNGGCFDTDDDGNLAGPGDANTAEAMDDCFFPAEPYQGADFQWLAANVIETATGDPLDLEDGKGDYADLGGYSLVDVNGTSVAFIGMTLDGTDELVAAAGIAGFTFEDEVTTANALVTEIQTDNPGVEAIFVLLHEGGIPTEFAIDGCEGISGPIVAINEGLDAEIDGVITGHTQQPYNCMLTDSGAGMRPVVSAWEHGKVVTEMTFDLDGAGDVDRSTFEVVNHPVLQDELTADPAVTAVIDKWSPIVDDLASDEVGQIAEDITRGGDPTGSDRGVESDAGNLVADAQFFAVDATAITPDVAFMNPGGVRSDLEFAQSTDMEGDGVVTFGEAFTFQPFGNTVEVLPMTGAQIKAVLEEQCQPSDASRPFLHLGVSDGFTYDLAYTTQAGVCTAIEVTNVQIGGVDIVDGDSYNVVVNSFLADGGDNFDTFAEIAPGDRLPSVGIDIEALTQYLTAESPVSAPGTDRVNETITALPAPPIAVEPGRILDTREGDEFTTTDGEFLGQGPLGAGEVLALDVRGRGGVSNDAESVTMNVGAIQPGFPGFLTVYPCDAAERPLASSINYTGANDDSNAITSLIADDGTVCIFSLTETDLYADVTGYTTPGGSPQAVVPARLVDDRDGAINDGTTDGEFEGGGPLQGGQILAFDVAGRGGVPADAKAALLNVVATQPVEAGFLTVFPCNADDEVPLASNVNYVAGGDFANGVTAGIGVDGQVCIFTSTTTNIVVDVNGFVPADGAPDPVTPFRLADSRIGAENDGTVDGQFEGDGPIEAETFVEIQVTGRNGIAADTESVILNVAAVKPESFGFLSVYPCNVTGEPTTSNINYMGGDIVANSVFVPLSDDGSICVYSKRTTDFVLDLTAAIGPVVPANPAAS